MPLVDVNGNTGATAPEQICVTAAKIGVTLGVIVTVNVVVVAHWPAVGVKVYVPVAVLLTVAGDQVPVIPLVDVNGNTGATEPSHIDATGLKVGVTIGVIVISKVVAAVAHWPAAGVNV
jgi:hypothetical protein